MEMYYSQKGRGAARRVRLNLLITRSLVHQA